MKNLFILFLIAVTIGFAIVKGNNLKLAPVTRKKTAQVIIPSIGRIQILNGCGSGGAAHAMASYLRSKNFDVKNIGNAEHWNFQHTLVISRVLDTSIAVQVAAALSTDKKVLIRNQETVYDVTVIIGNDYRERIQ